MKRVVALFLVKQALLFGVLSLTLILYSNFSSNNLEEGDITIRIVRGDTTSHELELIPSDTAWVDGGKKVTWSIDSPSNVKSFMIARKNSSPRGFKWYDFPPTIRQKRPGTGRTINPKDTIVYKYSIIWWDANGDRHPHDPKIAVKPSPGRFWEQLIYIVYALLAGLISFLTFRKR